MTLAESNVKEPLATATTADATAAAVEAMTAEELLRELEGLAPPEAQADAEVA